MSTSSRWRQRLAAALLDRVAFDVPLAPKVTFRIGGPADAFIRPHDAGELAAVLRIADEEDVPVQILGTGSNVLVADRGVRGITVRLAGELAGFEIGPARDGTASVRVGAGAVNAPLVAKALDAGLVGIEFLATIPGTFGGALVMNAGAHGAQIGSFVERVELLDGSRVKASRPATECRFGYRTSGFGPDEILTGADLVLPAGDVGSARARLKAMRRSRKETQPIKEPNAGSIFANPPGAHDGKLIEDCGFKGRSVGGARVSEVHANFIVNAGGATAADVVALAALAQSEVKDRYNIDLRWEVKRIGEWN